MVSINQLKHLADEKVRGYRLVNSKYPPVELFSDVASFDEFEALYRLQERTNPRLRTLVGNLGLIDKNEIPFGIDGCSYSVAPFTHLNPDGSRFSRGNYGVLYIAENMKTALAEVKYHQTIYWENVANLNYERFVFRGLSCLFSEVDCIDLLGTSSNDAILDKESYISSQALGANLRKTSTGLRFPSVRNTGNMCWGLFTPKYVESIKQAAHFEMIWQTNKLNVNKITNM